MTTNLAINSLSKLGSGVKKNYAETVTRWLASVCQAFVSRLFRGPLSVT